MLLHSDFLIFFFRHSLALNPDSFWCDISGRIKGHPCLVAMLRDLATLSDPTAQRPHRFSLWFRSFQILRLLLFRIRPSSFERVVAAGGIGHIHLCVLSLFALPCDLSFLNNIHSPSSGVSSFFFSFFVWSGLDFLSPPLFFLACPSPFLRAVSKMCASGPLPEPLP